MNSWQSIHIVNYMGVVAAAIAGAAVSASAGIYMNRKNEKANAAARAASMGDYQSRLDAAAKVAAQMQGEYEDLLGERPNLSWEEYVKSKIKAIDDPYLRQVYTEGKSEDFEKLRQFAKIASSDNTDNLMEAADKLSGGTGAFQKAIDERNRLVLDTDASSRFSRAYELAAPIRTGATTVKYDSQGNLIEGQRADKQAFSVANEVQTEVEREKLSNLRALEQDRISAAASQTEKARGFLQFYDPTSFAIDLDNNRMAAEMGFQMADEDRAFKMYQMFAGAAAGITPTQPTYANPNAGNELISGGINLATNALTSYYGGKQNQTTAAPKAQPVGNTYS